MSIRRCVLALLVVAGFAASASAAVLKTSAPYAIVMHANSGAILLEKNADELMQPASLSKLMTMVMVFEALKRGELSMDEELFISEKAWRRGGSRMFAIVGTKVPVRDLIQGVIVQSANDACIAFAEALSGSEEAFAADMTERARELGLTKSTFLNSTGWPDPGHLVTARELALIARRLIYEFGDYYKYYSQREFTWNKIKQLNRNPLLRLDIGVDGLKTGYTEESGYGLVASAQRNGQRIIIVINGLKTRKERAEEGRKLIQWAFGTFKPYRLFEDGVAVGEAAVWGGEKAYVPLKARKDVTVLMTRAARRKMSAEIVYTGPVRAPIVEGQQIAELRIRSIDNFKATIPLYAAQDMPEGGLLTRGLNALKFMLLGG